MCILGGEGGGVVCCCFLVFVCLFCSVLVVVHVVQMHTQASQS